MNNRLNNIPGAHSKPERMLRWIIGTAAGLTLLFIAILITRRSQPMIVEADWVIPLVAIFVAFTSVCVAVLALGRFQVQRDPLSFWVGIGFISSALGQFFFVLSWRGLLPNGGAILARLPDTSAIITFLNINFLAVFLLLAVLTNSSLRRIRPFGLGQMLVWVMILTSAFLLPFTLERILPNVLNPDMSYTGFRFGWSGVLFLLFITGGVLSSFHYRRTRDPLAGYIAFLQIVTTFIILMSLVSVRRYDVWWYSERLISVFGSLIVLFGLLSDYVSLFREVRESEGRYQQLTEALPQLIWTCLPDGYCNYLSPQWVAYTGIPAADQLGFKTLERIHPDDRKLAAEAWQKAMQTNLPFESEMRLRRGDGVYRWFTSRAHPIRDQEGRVAGWFGSSTDIEDQKRYAGQLERNNRDLREISFFTSHSLQEPLRKIEMYADKILTDAPVLEPKPRGQLSRLQKSAGQMRSMLADLFQLSRLDTDPLSLEPVDLSVVVGEIVASLETAIRRRQAVVEVDPLPVLQADRAQLCELFEQLIANALKFQSPAARPHIRVSAWVHDGQVELSVRDNGIGFAEEWAGRIFEPFQRLVGQNEFDGSGIGLALCRKIVERHRGSISVSSRPAEGSIFTIILPLIQDA